MTQIATCPDCSWSFEADHRHDAELASEHHWDADHAPWWCGFCQIPGPAIKRRDHDECIEISVLLELEGVTR